MALILFDLDGTLLDTAPDIYAAAKMFLYEQDLTIPSYDEVRVLIGGGVRNTVTQLLHSRSSVPKPDEFENLVIEFKEHYERATSQTKIFPGVALALDELIKQNHRLGVCTNKPTAMANTLLQKFNIASKFGAVVGPEDVAARKPDPRHLYAAVEALGGGPGIYVGDSVTDAEAAAAASMPFVLFRGGYHGDGDILAAAEFNEYSLLHPVLTKVLADYRVGI